MQERANITLAVLSTDSGIPGVGLEGAPKPVVEEQKPEPDPATDLGMEGMIVLATNLSQWFATIIDVQSTGSGAIGLTGQIVL